MVYCDRDTGQTDCYLVKTYNTSTGILTAYVRFHYDYYDSNYTHVTPNYDIKLPVTVICVK